MVPNLFFFGEFVNCRLYSSGVTLHGAEYDLIILLVCLNGGVFFSSLSAVISMWNWAVVNICGTGK